MDSVSIQSRRIYQMTFALSNIQYVARDTADTELVQAFTAPAAPAASMGEQWKSWVLRYNHGVTGTVLHYYRKNEVHRTDSPSRCQCFMARHVIVHGLSILEHRDACICRQHVATAAVGPAGSTVSWCLLVLGVCRSSLLVEKSGRCMECR